MGKAVGVGMLRVPLRGRSTWMEEHMDGRVGSSGGAIRTGGATTRRTRPPGTTWGHLGPPGTAWDHLGGPGRVGVRVWGVCDEGSTRTK